MRPGSKSWLPVIVLLTISSPALAQSNFHHVVPPPPASARTLAPRPAATRLPIAPMFRRIAVTGASSSNLTSGNSSTTSSNPIFLNGSPISLDQLLDPTPGFGFDFEHLNAVNPDLGIKAIIDP